VLDNLVYFNVEGNTVMILIPDFQIPEKFGVRYWNGQTIKIPDTIVWFKGGCAVLN
jgi:hypothetical protein